MPKPAIENFSTNIQVNNPVIKIGIVIGAIWIKNSMKSHPALPAISKFCGSPTVVHTPPSAVPTAPCITRSLKKPLKSSSSLALRLLIFVLSL